LAGTPGSWQVRPVLPRTGAMAGGNGHTWSEQRTRYARFQQVRPAPPGTPVLGRYVRSWQVRPVLGRYARFFPERARWLVGTGIPGRNNGPGTPVLGRHARLPQARPVSAGTPGSPRYARLPQVRPALPRTGAMAGGKGRTWSKQRTRYARFDQVRPTPPGTPDSPRYARFGQERPARPGGPGDVGGSG
jgi:hypothetical protein